MSAPIPQRWQDLKLLAEEELHRYAANPWPSHLLCAVEDIAALQAQNRALREALEELLFWIYPTEGDDLRKHDQFTDCAMDCYRLVGHDRAPEFFRAALAATEPKP